MTSTDAKLTQTAIISMLPSELKTCTNDELGQLVEDLLEDADSEMKALKEKIDADENIPEDSKNAYFISFLHWVAKEQEEADEGEDVTQDAAWKQILSVVKDKMGRKSVEEFTTGNDKSRPSLVYAVGDYSTGKKIYLRVIYDILKERIFIRALFDFAISPNSMPFAAKYILERNFSTVFTQIKYDQRDGEVYVKMLYPWTNRSAAPEDLEDFIRLVEKTAYCDEYETLYRYSKDDLTEEEVFEFLSQVRQSTKTPAISQLRNETNEE